ncbi:MAG: DegV family protein [Erysipelotrichaceae bacterium]|nr:DegV family protein [Erysipelotrichaceae bacterium]
MKKIAVMTDSGADISEQEATELGIHVIRLPLVINGVQYIESKDITRDDFISRMKKGCSVKTSSPILGELMKRWEKLLEEYDEILYIPLSSNLSGSYNTAMAASMGYEGRVVVVDAKFVCYPLTVLCKDVLKLIEHGYDASQIKALVEAQAEMWACLIPFDLTSLMRGGRISPAVAALGNMLKIVPILKVENGAIDVLNKVRTHKKAYDMAIKEICDGKSPDDYIFMIVDGDNHEAAIFLKEAMEELLHTEVEIHPMAPVIMSHTGPGTVALGWYRKLKY